MHYTHVLYTAHMVGSVLESLSLFQLPASDDLSLSSSEPELKSSALLISEHSS